MLPSNHKAFTMIELIFTIVIIGILASVAIPKLLVTRDDTKVTTIVANAKQFLIDLESFYTSQGKNSYIRAKTPQITNIPLYLNTNCRTRASIRQRNFVGSTLYLCSGNTAFIKITTSNRFQAQQTVQLTEIRIAGNVISDLLSTNSIFQSFTNGTVGRTYIVGGSKVTP